MEGIHQFKVQSTYQSFLGFLQFPPFKVLPIFCIQNSIPSNRNFQMKFLDGHNCRPTQNLKEKTRNFSLRNLISHFLQPSKYPRINSKKLLTPGGFTENFLTLRPCTYSKCLPLPHHAYKLNSNRNKSVQNGFSIC